MTSNTPNQAGGKLISQRALRKLTFLLLLGGVTYWFYDLIQPFLMTVFWAVVLAIVFWPVQNWLLRKAPQRQALAASLTTLLIVLVVVVPLTLIVFAVIAQVTGLIDKVNSEEIDPNIAIQWVEDQVPFLREQAAQIGVDFDEIKNNVRGAIAAVGQTAANFALEATQNLLGILVNFFLMLYFLWFFLYDGTRIVGFIMRALPLGDNDELTLLNRFAIVSRATLKGTMIVAIVQGTLGGLLFWGVGIEGALFWGVLMTLLSLLPVGGSAVIWVPAAIIMAIQGSWGKAIIIVAFGALAIGLVDNLLRPVLVGRDTKMPDYLVLIATLGGIASFGLAGFVIGPVVAAMFLTVWAMVMRELEKRPQNSDIVEAS